MDLEIYYSNFLFNFKKRFSDNFLDRGDSLAARYPTDYNSTGVTSLRVI